MQRFTINNLLEIYKKYQKIYGENTYQHISKILQEAKPLHKKYFVGVDHEQSWKAFKGKNLERLISYIIEIEIKKLGLSIISGSKLERTKEENLSN